MIYHTDCREVLSELPNKALLLTDPPYGISMKTDFTTLPSGGIKHKEIHGDDHEFDAMHLLKFEKIILWGANNYVRFLPPSNAWLVWDKRYGHDRDAFLGDAELAWTNLKGGVRICRIPWASPKDRASEGRWHGTQKPIGLMEWCIDRVGWITGPAKTKEWDGPIIDAYMGSGTTLCAAKKCGRPAIGIEIEEKYCEIAANRLRQSVLFGVESTSCEELK